MIYDREQAVKTVWELRHSNRAAAKLMISMIRGFDWYSKESSGWLDDIWGAIYPDDPQGWEYPAQIVRHVRCVAEELNEAKTLVKDLLSSGFHRKDANAGGYRCRICNNWIDVNGNRHEEDCLVARPEKMMPVPKAKDE